MKLEEACEKAIKRKSSNYIYISNDNELEIAINTKTGQLEPSNFLTLKDLKNDTWEIVK